MKITDQILNIFRRGSNVLPRSNNIGFYGRFREPAMPFADVIFLNVCQLLTDLCNDVTFVRKSGDSSLFYAYSRFFKNSGQRVLDMLYRDGVVVIGHTKKGEGKLAQHHFRVLRQDECRVDHATNYDIIKPKDESIDVYCMRSVTYETTNCSDKNILHPFLTYLDNVLNASNTCSARLGSVIFATPKTATGQSSAAVLQDFEKEDIEKEIERGYGALADQSQICLFSNDLNFTTINLAGLDQRTTEKVKMAILAISDRIKVPANQIGIIDANSSKSLANGTEMREGDYNKYQSFERLLNHTFVKMAEDIGLVVDYSIYNKPIRQTTTI